jgi:hypothetical protein
MDHETIKNLLDRYWLAETSVEEEKALAAYFRGPDIDPRLEPFRDLFAYFEEEAQVTPGKDFESRILDRILREEASAAMPETDSAPSVRPVRRWLNTSYAAAAAVILAIGAYLMYQPAPSVPGPGTATTMAAKPAVNTTASAIKDTYDDPQQALAAIRHALLTASVRMNQGKDITKKNMDRLSETWQKTIKL